MIVFVFTRFDDIDDHEKVSVMADARARITTLRGKTLTRVALFFVDAREALRARVPGDDDRFTASSVAVLGRALERFLVQDLAHLTGHGQVRAGEWEPNGRIQCAAAAVNCAEVRTTASSSPGISLFLQVSELFGRPW